MNNNRPRLLNVPLDGLPVAETDMAYGLPINGKTVWLPKSQIQEWQTTNGSASFWVPEWLIVDKKLDLFVDTSYEPSLF